MDPFKKIDVDLDLNLTMPKVKSVVLSYVPLRPKQLLSDIFSKNASLKKYFGAIFKIEHPV